MFNIVQKRRWFFLLSALVIVPGLAIMIYSTASTGAPFRLSIDFLGGSIYELKFNDIGASEDGLRQVFISVGDENVIIQQIGQPAEYRWSVRAGFHEVNVTNEILARLGELAPIDRDSFRVETVSATIGQEVTRSALAAVVVGALVVTGFIVIAFRQVPNAIRYGVCAIAAMIHDILVVMGVMSLFRSCSRLGDRRPIPNGGPDRSRIFSTRLYRGIRSHPRKHPQASWRALRNDCQPQHLGDNPPLLGHSAKCFLHHDRDSPFWWGDGEAIHSHPFYRLALRHIFINLYCRAIAGSVGKRRAAVCRHSLASGRCAAGNGIARPRSSA